MAGEDSAEYTAELVKLQMTWWKRLLRVQAPYGWYLRRVCRGSVLEVGCGSAAVSRCSRDEPSEPTRTCIRSTCAVAAVSSRSHRTSSLPGVRSARTVRHAAAGACRRTHDAASRDRLDPQLPWLPGSAAGAGHVVAPQERGFAWQSDAHVEFMDFAKLTGILDELGFRPERQFSFPLPRFAGRWFVYNEFVVTGVRHRVGAGGAPTSR